MATTINLGNCKTDVRGGGYGGEAWIARITGTDPKFGLKRAFLPKDKSGLSGSGRSGSICFELDEPGLYEFRGFCVGSTAKNWEWSGFMLIDDDGTTHEISKTRAIALAKQNELEATQ